MEIAVSTKPTKIGFPAKVQEIDNDEDQVQDDAIIGRALRMSLGLAAAVGLIAFTIYAVAWFSREPIVEKSTALVLPERRNTVALPKPKMPLTDITAESGIDWKHFNAMEGEKLLPE